MGKIENIEIEHCVKLIARGLNKNSNEKYKCESRKE